MSVILTVGGRAAGLTGVQPEHHHHPPIAASASRHRQKTSATFLAKLSAANRTGPSPGSGNSA
jgi:hypothetical protein